MTILWWHWVVFGLIVAAGELVAPGGFYIIFIGVAAIVVGLLASVGGNWAALDAGVAVFNPVGRITVDLSRSLACLVSEGLKCPGG